MALKTSGGRVYLYLVLLTVVVTVAFMRLSQVVSAAAAWAVSFQPTKRLIFATHPAICEVATDRIAKMNANEKVELARYIAKVVELGPAEAKAAIENNWMMRLLSQQLTLEDVQPRPPEAWASACLADSLRALGAAGLEALPALIDAEIKKRAVFGDANNLAEAMIANNQALATSVIQGILSSPKTSPESKKILLDRLQLMGPDGFAVLLAYYIEIARTGDVQSAEFNAALAALPRFVGYQSGKVPKILRDALLDSKLAAERRIGLIKASRLAYIFPTDEGRDIVIALSADADPLVAKEVQPELGSHQIRNQKDIDRFVEANKSVVEKLDLANRPEDWAKVEAIVKVVSTLQTLNYGGAIASINLVPMSEQATKILRKVGQQVGYQTKIFGSLAGAVMSSPLAQHQAAYWTELLKQKNEKELALQYLFMIETWPDATYDILSTQVATGSAEDRQKILTSMVNNSSRLYKKTAPSLLKVAFSLLGGAVKKDEENRVRGLAFQFLSGVGEPLIPHVNTELKAKAIDPEKKLDLLRLQAHLSSTAVTGKALDDTLLATRTCSYGFVMGFSQRLGKKPDSPAARLDTAGAGARFQYNPQQVFPIIAYVVPEVYTVVNPPSKALLQKYLDCKVEYLKMTTLHALFQHSTEFRAIILKKIESETGERKEHFEKSTKTNDMPVVPDNHDDLNDI